MNDEDKKLILRNIWDMMFMASPERRGRFEFMEMTFEKHRSSYRKSEDFLLNDILEKYVLEESVN